MAREEEIVPEEEEDVQESERLVARNPQTRSSSRAPAENPQGDCNKEPERRPILLDPWGLASVILAVVIALLVLKWATPAGLGPKLWTPEELAKYNGTDESLPLLLGVLGSVFDVSRGRKHYGPGGGYHHFAGRDASRAFVSGNFTGDGLTNSLQGLTALEVKRIHGWRTFFREKYKYMGTLVGRFYDRDGKPTKELARVAHQVALAENIEQLQREDEKRFPSCNSQWNPQQGGQVWCEKGYPRIVETISEGVYKGTTRTRCACFEKKFLGKKGLKVYDDCFATSQKCQSAPPQAEES